MSRNVKLNDGLVHQGTLEKVLQKLFPDEDLKTNVRRGAKIKNPRTGSSLEIDVWFPTLHLCFEFQDAYHYVTSHDSQLPLDTIKNKDNVKKEILKQRGETLIAVPCWWDGKPESLGATIRRVRPDLLEDSSIDVSGEPIPRDPPEHFMTGPVIPHVGELMLVSFPTKNFGETLDADTPWWLGEKYDGVRCCWVPDTATLYGRSGVPVPLPTSIEQIFPSSFLDGELWCGRGMFAETQRIVLDIIQINWNNIKAIVFDNPARELNELPYEQRYQELLSSFDNAHPFLIPAPRMRCSSKKISHRNNEEHY